ncbi:MAG: ankyrin repeat domain-containing protein [Candidatus Babeliales bacterium]|jgi:hypothetical protein
MLLHGNKKKYFLGAALFSILMGKLVAINEAPEPIKAKILIYLDVAAWSDCMNQSLKEKNWRKTRSLIEFLDSAVNPPSLSQFFSEQQATLLMMAAQFDTVPTVRRILRYIRPADRVTYINARDRDGHTALDYAAFSHHMKIIEALRSDASEKTMKQVEGILRKVYPCEVLRRLKSGALMCLSDEKGSSHQDPSDEDDEKGGKIK